jgi:dihydropyrimidinase
MNRFVELCCTNPAKIFGMYPRKGTLAVGSDADVVIWNPNLKKTVSVSNTHQRTDYNLYEGMELQGLPEKVLVRGNMIVDGEKWLGKAGQGKFIKRSPNAAVI